MTSLRIAAWNINGLLHNKHEVLNLIKMNKLDIVLISEAHLTDTATLCIKEYCVYTTCHPDGKSHAGTAIIVKKTVKHSILPEFKKDCIQATSILIEDKLGEFSVTAVYCPPRHSIKEEQFSAFFNTLGPKFLAGGDWNAKNISWGSRTTLTRGRELKSCIDNNTIGVLTTRQPTIWPSDPKKNPDLIDFFVYKGITEHYLGIESCSDSSSDHTPIIATISTTIIEREKKEYLYNKKTDWDAFRDYITENLKLNMPLKSEEDVESATAHITNIIQTASWLSTPILHKKTNMYQNVPVQIRDRVLEKRRLRRTWHYSRREEDKTAFNKAAQDLKIFLKDIENETLQNRLENMSAMGNKEHSLWKAIRASNKPQPAQHPLKIGDNAWAKTDDEKCEAFGQFLQNAFTPHATSDGNYTEKEINEYLQSDLQPSPPIKGFSPSEVRTTISRLELKKAPGYDLITAEILRELPRKAIVYLTSLFNCILRTSCFPYLWKVSQILMIPKPGKDHFQVSSYRPISLLPVLSKVLEKLILTRMNKVIEEHSLLPDHQFGFRGKHSTIEQVHRVVGKIRQTLELKQYCSATFLDVQQAFDRVWHEGLLYKIKANFPHNYFTLLKSYLEGRIFQVIINNSSSRFQDIKAGVPQGSVLGPVLYTLFTADIPNTPNTLSATFADDTAVLSSDADPTKASERLQAHLNQIHHWMLKWKIKASASKSVHVTYTLRTGNCPPVKLGDETLPQSDVAKYLGMHLDRRQTWRTHIQKKRDELNARYRTLLWLMGRHSRLSVNNKLLTYKSVLKPVWTYGLELWGTASNSNLEILQRFQNAVFRTIINAPWFVKVTEVHDYVKMLTIKEEIYNASKRYKTRLTHHVNRLAAALTDTTSNTRRLKRYVIEDLDTRK